MATRTIGSSGADDVDLATWESGLSADPSSDEIGNIILAEDVGAATINVSNTNSVNIKVTVSSSVRYDQGASWPGDMHAALTEGAHIATASASPITIETRLVTVEYLAVRATGDFYSGIYAGTTDEQGHTFQYCYADMGATTPGSAFYVRNADSSRSPEAKVSHCGAWDGENNFFARAGAVVECGHCTALNATDTNFRSAQSSAVMDTDNCLGVGGSTADYGATSTGTLAGDYNLSSDTSAPGTTTYHSVAASTALANVTAGQEDLHMASGADGSYEGADISATYGSVDVDGDSRGAAADNDVGLDEYVAAATSIPIFYHHYRTMMGT